ncbi:GH25 family lysozyme [Streptomyces radicis]|uniref:lysozyme n=1 Tax=Streptomyces radicis TaxID=1750517 RepID=A0A3A9VYH3_9ACTN|nr:GH25 family lysozyme [Streptomyces radicis]RKN05193.1 lysozyme [Streptomyces radicis]RKN16726.1 lysozyme [Streptomyces radicis]
MLSRRSSARSRARWRSATLAGVLGALFALLLATPHTAAASSPAAQETAAPAADPTPLGDADPVPDEIGDIEEGEAFMGAGTLIHEGPAAEGQFIAPFDTSGVQGIDVSHWQGSINWGSVRGFGIQFAWMKATEGTSFRDSSFNTNYPAAHAAGVIRGAYHFARPNVSSGAVQANYFASNGGAWSRDNLTLPGVLDIEANPYGASCYGLSQTAMRNWITDFYNTYKARTTRDVVIYTSPGWWNSCTGSWNGMASRSPLWVAHWTTGSPTLPGGFGVWTAWQYTSTGSVSGVSGNVDRNKFNGSRDRLLALANNTA